MSKQGLITNSKLLLKHLLPFLWLVYREEIIITQELYLMVITAITPLQLSVEVTYVSNGAVIVSCEMYANLIVLSGSPCTIEKVN